MIFGTMLLSCSKDENPLPADLPMKANKYQGDYKSKDFKLKKIKSTITHLYYPFPITVTSSYELIYNQRGSVERINVINTSNWEYYFQVFFNGARMDSVSGNSKSGSGPHLSGMKYKGNNIVEFLFHTSQLTKIKLNYDNKGQLLNTPFGYPLIYDQNGFLSKILYPIEFYTSEFQYDKTQNPLFFENSYILLFSTEVMELCYSKWNIALKKQAGEIITHHNTYDEIGRIIGKKYKEYNSYYSIEFTYY